MSRPDPKRKSLTESLVMFRNSQGVEARGTLIHLTRNIAVFEVYNPYSIVQLSEVLQDLRILRGERTIYNGRAVVSNLLSTGLMVICSATLVDPWTELADLIPGRGLREELDRFIEEWSTTNAIAPSFRLAVGDLKSFLGEMSRLLQQVDVALETNPPKESGPGFQELMEEIMPSVAPKVQELLTAFEHEASRIDPEAVASHKMFARSELHPFLLCSPFIHRIYAKPLGYAGDYIMVKMIMDASLDGANTYAKLINYFYLNQPPARAHRNRIDILLESLHNEAARFSGKERPMRVMNIGCGPAAEVQRFIREDGLSERCEFHLLDFNQETLDYARETLQRVSKETGRKPNLAFIHQSIHELLKGAATHDGTFQCPSFDLVYCAGLFDYLGHRVCKRLLQFFYRSVLPGGLLIATNVHPSNPTRYFMEHIAEWHLIYRGEDDMKSLSPRMDCRTYLDSTGVNVFLEIRKKEGEGG
jgi:extracellular factor (EF) 3-hydroxypalmitic acid methyl ester biosynthesis protein